MINDSTTSRLVATHVHGRRYRVVGTYFFESFDCVVDLETRTNSHPTALAPHFEAALLHAATCAEAARDDQVLDDDAKDR